MARQIDCHDLPKECGNHLKYQVGTIHGQRVGCRESWVFMVRELGVERERAHN